MDKKIFSRNLKRVMAQKGVNQSTVSKALGVHSATFSTWYNGTYMPRPDKIQALADYFGVDVKNLTTEQKNNMIPVIGCVKAGFNRIAMTDIVDYIDADSGDFALRVTGDSMQPVFVEGDDVIVKRDVFPQSGDYVIAIVGKEEGMLKKIDIKTDCVLLLSENPAYPPLKITKNEELRIIGVVKELRRQL